MLRRDFSAHRGKRRSHSRADRPLSAARRRARAQGERLQDPCSGRASRTDEFLGLPYSPDMTPAEAEGIEHRPGSMRILPGPPRRGSAASHAPRWT